MPTIYGKVETAGIKERKIARETVCGQDHWIKSYPNGLRVISPYHCGTCDECLRRRGMKIKAKLESIAYINDLRCLRVGCGASKHILKDVSSEDYVRIPCSSGFDYIFMIGKGIPFFDMEIDWNEIARPRKGARKSGKLITYKKEKEKRGEPIRITDIKCVSYEIALDAAKKVKSTLTHLSQNIDGVNECEALNNITNEWMIKYLERYDAFVFDHTVTRYIELPIKFEINFSLELFM